MTNILLNTDSYKASHFFQYPEGAQYVSSYIEARGCDRLWEESVFLGVQGFIKEYLLDPITQEDIDEAATMLSAHGVPFNRDGWEYILKEHDGYLPLSIEALPEGSVVNLKNCLVQVVNTDSNVPWLTSYIETALLRAIWYPTTVATQSREIKKTIKEYLEKTADESALEGLNFMLHDFGSRGVSSKESAGVGGFAHIVNFLGTDTIESMIYARDYYGADEVPAYSVTATEHSTVTSWGRFNEADMYRHMIRQNKGNGEITSIVSDSYDIFNAIEKIYGEKLYQDILDLGARGGRLVVRPDSGDPTLVPIQCVEALMSKFGYEKNSKGYRVLPDFLRVLQGDGINQESIRTILRGALARGLSAENFVFGMGGALLQGIDRDTLKFAMKASAICVKGDWRDVYKDPVTSNTKKSKRGRLMVSRWRDETTRGYSYRTTRLVENANNCLTEVFRDGKLLVETNLAEIRERAAI